MSSGGLRPDADVSAAARLGRALIMCNDLLSSPDFGTKINNRRSLTQRRIALQLQVGSFYELSNPPQIHYSIVRSEAIFGKLREESGRLQDLNESFQQRHGISIEEYVDHILGVLTYFIAQDIDRFLEDPGLACVALKTLFGKSPPAIVERFWQMLLTSTERLATSLRAASNLIVHHDFMEFRRRPFFDVGSDNAIPLYLGFIQEKLESGLFWTIFDSLPSAEQRDRLFTGWGHLFESYVSKIFRNGIKDSSGAYIPAPRFDDNDDEAFDGLVRRDDCWVVMEYKGGFLSAGAKYGENEDEFVRDLNRKFGAAKGAGMEQLCRKIASVFAGKPSQRRALHNIDDSTVRTVIPVLIVQDSFVSSEITSSYLMDIFGELKRKCALRVGIYCTFPIVIEIAELEALKPFLAAGTISFPECLMERIRFGSSRFLSFRDFFREYLQSHEIRAIKDDETLTEFTRIMDRISRRFFGKSLDESPGEVPPSESGKAGTVTQGL